MNKGPSKAWHPAKLVSRFSHNIEIVIDEVTPSLDIGQNLDMNGSTPIKDGARKESAFTTRALHNLVSLFHMRFFTHLRACSLNRKNSA